MKALLLASFVVGSNAVAPTDFCSIPSDYALNSGLGSCTGPAPGYLVNIFCYDPANPGTSLVRQALDTTTASGFAQPTLSGCLAPGENALLMSGVGLDGRMNTAITTTCPLTADSVAPVSPALKAKGVEVVCAPGYYPTQGADTMMFCGAGDVTAWWSSPAAALTSGALLPFPNQPAGSLTNAATKPICRQPCTITDTTICQNSQVQVVGTTFYPAENTKNGVLADCQILPGKTVNFISKYGRKIVYQCNAAAANPGAGTLVNTEGAMWLNQIRSGYEAWYYGAVGQSAIPAGTYNNDKWKGVKAIISNTVPAFRAVTPIPGLTPQTLVVDGCASVECTQDALLWARCNGFQFWNDMCYAASVQIPCPTEERGFSCPDSSKKGLLGLLGLLGLIPLLLCCCLLLCCLFGPCALRRKKSGADVQFATFDPHAAPVAQSFVAQPCMPMEHCAPAMDYCAPTACATGYVA